MLINFMSQEDYFLDGENLTSLTTKIIPKIVYGVLFIDVNRLENLIGSPEEVVLYIKASNNRLKTLYGSPKKLGWGFYFYKNNLTSLDFLPLMLGGQIRFI